MLMRSVIQCSRFRTRGGGVILFSNLPFGSSRNTTTSSVSHGHHHHHLRKARKWPLSPYKAKWQDTFNERQAMEALKLSAVAATATTTSSEDHLLLSALIDSFSIYHCHPTPHAYHFIIKTLTQNSQFHHLPQVLHRLQTVEKFETPEFIFIDLISTYGDAGMIQHAIDLFLRIPNFRCIPTVESLNSLLSVLCKQRECIRFVPQILLNSQSMNICIEESTCQILIEALCRIRKVDYAIKVLSYMTDDGYGINERVGSTILSSLCGQKDISVVEFMGLLDELKRLGFCPGRADWRNVIRFWVKKGKGKDAVDALDQMKMDGIKPDVVCYTMVLGGVVEEGMYKKADELFDEMLILGLVPDVRAFNVYINGLCKQNKVEEGLNMLVCMEELGCRPDLVTYNTLLEGLCKVGELSRARELLRKRMELNGIQPNSVSYGIIIDGLIKEGEKFDEACALLTEMWDRGLIPQSSTLDEIICGLCQRGLVGDALKQLKESPAKNVAPGVRAWETLLLASKFRPCLESTSMMDSTDLISLEN